MTADLSLAGTDRALASVCSAPPDVFSNEVWARRAWLSRAEDLSDTKRLFSVAAVDKLLSRRGLRTPFLRLAKDGKVTPPAEYTGSGGVGAKIADQIHDDDVLRLFADGSTVVLQGLHRTWEPVGELAGRLAAELGHPVQVNAYITPAQSQGFAPHYDTHDVFVLQIFGEKHWMVHEPVVHLPTDSWDTVADQVAARAQEPPAIDATLNPGDCLYLPRGFIHSAKALGGTTVHLTFGVHAVTACDVVAAILEQVTSQAWRESMPVGWDPLHHDLQPLLDAARDQLALVDLDQVARTLHDRRALAQRPEPISPIAQAHAADTLTSTDVVRLRRRLGASLLTEGLTLPDGQVIEISEADRGAVSQLLTGHPEMVRNLGCDPATIAGLLRAGVLVIESRR